MVLLDEVRFEEECLGDAVGEHVFESLGALDHSYVPNLEGRPEVRSHAIAEHVGLPDIEDPALGVLEEVHPRLRRK